MDNHLIRERIREAQAALDRHDQERRYLAAILESYQGLARLNDPSAPAPPVAPAGHERVTFESLTSGEHANSAPKLNDAVLQVLRSRPGIPTTHIELWEGAEALGTKSDSENPPYSADSTARNLSKKYRQIHKVRPRVWVWLEDTETSEGDVTSQSQEAEEANAEEVPQALGNPDLFRPVVRAHWETDEDDGDETELPQLPPFPE